MHLLRNLPIKQKLTVIVMLTSGAALLLALAAFTAYQQINFRHALATDLSVLAEMFGNNVASGLTFQDPKSIETTLKSLDAHSNIIAAAVYDKEGKVVSAYLRGGGKQPFHFPKAQNSVSRFQKNQLEAFQQIHLDGEAIGTIYISSDLRQMDEQFRRCVIIGGLVLILSCLAAFALAAQLQRIISRPVSHLARIASQVAGERNYSVRAVRESEDELGELIDSFNSMLGEIQNRDSALREARDQLEERVAERTRALTGEIQERHRTEEERDRIFVLSLDMLCVAGLDGVLQRVNPAFEKAVGLSSDELLSRSFLDMTHPEDHTLAAAELAKLSRGYPIVDHQLRMVRKDNSVRWISWSAIPVQQDKVFFAYGRDITERKRAESELEAVHKELMDASRRAGMAEVATGVLHNVGNVLNSVNVSATLITEQLRKSRACDLGRVVGLLRDHSHDLGQFLTTDPKGKKVVEFLDKLATRLNEEQWNHIAELESLRQNIEHIKEIVAMQQSYASVSGVTESISLTDLVEDTLRMNAGAFLRHEVRIEREYQQVPSIHSEKHKILQILINLVRNAKYACDESGRTDKQITLQVTNHHDTVKVAVIDNGVGVTAENLTRIFNHGFTTRKEGHGFGLHSGALAAKELGGSLTVYSDGAGRGATFTLELPFQPPSINAVVEPAGTSTQ